MVFPPKKVSLAETVSGAERAPPDTRPLSLKDCSNKVIASMGNLVLKGPIAAGVCPLQRGFVQGRNPSLNVVELDSART